LSIGLYTVVLHDRRINWVTYRNGLNDRKTEPTSDIFRKPIPNTEPTFIKNRPKNRKPTPMQNTDTIPPLV